MKKILPILLLLLTPLAASAQAQKPLIGFQGLPWGSSMATVKAKFPQAKELDYCKAFDGVKGSNKTDGKSMRQRFQEEDSNCVHLYVGNYSVSTGVNYDLAFYFTQAGRLEQVYLSKYFRQEDNAGYLSDCTSMFDRTNSLLTINYGYGVDPKNANEMKSSYRNISAKLWVPMPTEIILKRQWGFILSMDENKPDLCQVDVLYSKRGVDKL